MPAGFATVSVTETRTLCILGWAGAAGAWLAEQPARDQDADADRESAASEVRRKLTKHHRLLPSGWPSVTRRIGNGAIAPE